MKVHECELDTLVFFYYYYFVLLLWFGPLIRCLICLFCTTKKKNERMKKFFRLFALSSNEKEAFFFNLQVYVNDNECTTFYLFPFVFCFSSVVICCGRIYSSQVLIPTSICLSHVYSYA